MSENFSLLNLQNQLLSEKAKQELRACNAVSERFGLSLSEGEIEEFYFEKFLHSLVLRSEIAVREGNLTNIFLPVRR